MAAASKTSFREVLSHHKAPQRDNHQGVLLFNGITLLSCSSSRPLARKSVPFIEGSRLFVVQIWKPREKQPNKANARGRGTVKLDRHLL